MKDIENQKAETSVVRTFGSNVLLSTRNKNRSTECFATKADAIIRTEKKYMDFSSGEKRPHDHTGPLKNVIWQEKACINEVNNYPDGTLINYSDLSRKFDLKFSNGRIPGNTGMKKLAELNRKADTNEKLCVRRKIRKFNVLDKSISIPQEESNFKVNDKIKKMSIDGKIIIGDLIVPQIFERKVLRDNMVVNDEYLVQGRKVPFNYIWSSFLQRHDKFLRLRKDEEYDDMSRDEIILGLKRINEYEISDINTNTMLLLGRLKGFERKRHLCVWHDTSPICNHSHLLITINCCYDPAIFYTNQEYEEKYVDVQACVEDPVWCISLRNVHLQKIKSCIVRLGLKI